MIYRVVICDACDKVSSEDARWPVFSAVENGMVATGKLVFCDACLDKFRGNRNDQMWEVRKRLRDG